MKKLPAELRQRIKDYILCYPRTNIPSAGNIGQLFRWNFRGRVCGVSAKTVMDIFREIELEKSNKTVIEDGYIEP
jgi:hypothetical protein